MSVALTTERPGLARTGRSRSRLSLSPAYWQDGRRDQPGVRRPL
jgi:hypothetical protein